MRWDKILELMYRLDYQRRDGGKKILEQKADVLAPLIVRLQKAIILFTGGNVASVRDPSKFNPNKVSESFKEIWEYSNNREILPHSVRTLKGYEKFFRHAFINYPTIEDYLDAHGILSELSMSDLSNTLPFYRTSPRARYPTIDSRPDTIFRLIHLHWKEAMDFLNPKTTQGDLGRPVSTSYEREATYSFASHKHLRVNLLFIIKHKDMGVYVGRYSVYSDEKEIISGGKYKINDIEVTYINGGQIDSGTGVDRQTAFDAFKSAYYDGGDATKLSTEEQMDLTRKRNDMLFPDIAGEYNLTRYPMCFIVECELI